MIIRLRLFFARRAVRSCLALFGNHFTVDEAMRSAFIDLAEALAYDDNPMVLFNTMVVEECRRWMSRQSPTRGG